MPTSGNRAGRSEMPLDELSRPRPVRPDEISLACYGPDDRPSEDLSAHGCGPRPGWRSWPDQELDRLVLAAPDVSHHGPAESPSRTGTTSPSGEGENA
jgi:hypothetical protein